MKLQVLLPLMLAATLAVIGVILPIGAALAANRTQELVLTRSASMDHIVQLAELALDADDMAAAEQYLDVYREVYGEQAAVVDATGRVVASTAGLDTGSAAFRRLAATAARNLPQMTVETLTPFSEDTALIAEPILTSGETTTGAVILAVDQTAARHDVRWSWSVIGLVGAALLVVLGMAALRWTHWVLRPVRVLDDAAQGYPTQRIAPDQITGPVELRRLASSFSRMAAGVERTITQQREFVADASHQLRNPLAAIRLRVDGLTLDAPERSDELQAVSDDLDRLEGTVSRMLDLATAEHRATVRVSGAQEDHGAPRRSHVLAGADALVQPLRPLLDSWPQRVVVSPGETLRVRCARSDLEEIVAALLDNAHKYAGESATIRVALRRRGDEAEVSVEDDGPGLSDEEFALAGTRFWRSPRHRGGHGTGLGLAIVDQLVRANDGRLTLQRSDAGGLRVVVTFGVDE